MSVDQFVRAFEAAIEGIPPNSLKPDTAFTAIEQWDSLAALTVLAMIDADYEVQVSGNELKSCKTLGDLFAIVSKKKQG